MYYRLLAGIATAWLLAGCADEDLAPVITFSDLDVGAFPRLLALESDEFDIENLDATSVGYTVELDDGGTGSRITGYRVYGSFEDQNTGNGDQSADEVLLRNLTEGDFGVSDDGLPLVEVDIPSSEVISTFNLEADSILAGDRLRIRTEVDADGQTWSTSNSSSAITNAFGGLFNLNAIYTCPLPDGFLVGDYRVEVIDGRDSTSEGPAFDLDDTYALAPSASGSTLRTFGATILKGRTQGAIENTFTIEFTCDRAVLRTADTGESCDVLPIVLRSAGAGEFDISDDDSFTLPVDFFGAGNGDCGYESSTATLQFTKV